MHWAVIFEDDEGMMAVRADRTRRDAHVAYAKAHSELLIGGGLKTDVGNNFCGALWIVEAQTKQEVESLVLNDPFYEAQHRKYKIFTWGKILEDRKVTL